MTNPRMRLAAAAGSMALAMSIVATPAMAQADPTATIQGFLDQVVAKNFEALPSYFCEDQADQAGEFDMSELAEGLPPEMDVQALLDAFVFEVQLDSLYVVSQSDTEAVVDVVGNLSMDIDPEPLVPFITTVIEMSGMEADEATVDMFMGMMLAEFEGESEDISGEVTLVPGEEMAWLICSDLDFGVGDEMSEEEMSEEAPAE